MRHVDDLSFFDIARSCIDFKINKENHIWSATSENKLRHITIIGIYCPFSFNARYPLISPREGLLTSVDEQYN